MRPEQIAREILAWAKYGLGVVGVAMLALVVLKVFGVSVTAVRASGSVTELAVLAAACIYAGR